MFEINKFGFNCVLMQTVEEHTVKVVLSDSSMSGFEPSSEPLSLF